MINWNDPKLVCCLATIFFLLLHVTLKALLGLYGKEFHMKFPLCLAGLFFTLALTYFDFGWGYLDAYEYVCAAMFGIVALLELLTTGIYKLFRIDEKLDQKSSLIPGSSSFRYK